MAVVLSVALTLLLPVSVQGKSLQVGDDFYFPGPPVRLSSYIQSEKFSRDGQFLTFIDERPEASYPTEKDLISRGVETPARALVRFDLRRGVRQTLVVPGPGETLMRTEPVGTGGDVIVTLAIGKPEGDLRRWRAIYCPVGGTGKVVADNAIGRTFQIAASTTERKAFILLLSPDGPAQYSYITPERTEVKTLSTTAFQGSFFIKTSAGNSVAAFQGPAPSFELLGNFEFDFATGAAKEIKDITDVERPVEVPPLVNLETELRSKGDPALGHFPLSDLVARPGTAKLGRGFLSVSQGIIGKLSNSPSGLAVVYLSSDGYFLRELIKADSKLRDRLKSGNR
ncbi:hypothetical protein MCEMSE15_01780 [Fimbriimonadaceae bacterium]